MTIAMTVPMPVLPSPFVINSVETSETDVSTLLITAGWGVVA